MLVTVSEQGANIGGRLYISFIKLLNSVGYILSVVKRIQLEFWYDIITGVFFIGTKLRSDIMSSCSVVIESKYGSLQWTNKESANIFTNMRERQAIITTKSGILLIGPLGSNFSEIFIEIHTFSFKKRLLKISPVKRRPFCLCLNVLTQCSL